MGEENFAPTGIRSLDSPPCSESLYRLSYRDPISTCIWLCNLVLYIKGDQKLLVFKNIGPRKAFGPGWMEVTGDWRKIRNAEIYGCTPCQFLLGWWNQGQWDGWGMQHIFFFLIFDLHIYNLLTPGYRVLSKCCGESGIDGGSNGHSIRSSGQHLRSRLPSSGRLCNLAMSGLWWFKLRSLLFRAVFVVTSLI